MNESEGMSKEQLQPILEMVRPVETAAMTWRKKAGIMAASIAVVAGIGVSANTLAEENPGSLGEAVEAMGDIGLTPTPDVSSAGTETLITINDTLRDVGPYALLGGGAMLGSLALARRRNEKLDATFSYADRMESISKTRASRLLPPIIIASVAVASGLGDAAGEGANKPLSVIQDSVGVEDSSPVIVQHDKVIPFNHSSVTNESLELIENELNVTVTPFKLSLGSMYSPDKDSNPSSAPIVAIPNEHLENTFNVSFEDADEECDNLSVVIGDQLGVSPGETVVVEGREATIADTIDVLPGLDRVAVIGSLEQMNECIFEGDSDFGAIIGGDENIADLQSALTDLGIDYSVSNFGELNANYAEFWDRSVKPPMMQLILLAFGAGAAGVMYIRNSEILRQNKQIATLVAQGVQKTDLIQAENLRSLKSGLRAALYAGPMAVALTGVVNSSQFGLEMSADVKSIGAGFATYGVVSVIGSRGAKKSIRNLDAAAELRAGA